jgi:enoyl-CoA hydratase/carnithine racemase
MRDLAPVFEPADLLAAARFGGDPAPSPLGEATVLACRLARGLADPEAQELAAWLRERPCPVIGLAGAAPDPRLAAACDVVLEDAAALPGLTAAVAKAPLAATVLVQVLRATETLPLSQALVVESLAFAALQNGPEFRAWLAARPPMALDDDPGPPLRVERDGGVLRLTLDRPARRNAVDRRMRDALVEALDLARADHTLEQVEIAGAGRCFSIGGDLAEFGSTPDPATAHAIRLLRSPAFALARVADRLSVRVHGVSIGAGVEFAGFGRRVVARAGASFQLPEVGMGLIPGAGGCVSLPRRIGRQKTALLALSGRRISAATALAWGLVDAVE